MTRRFGWVALVVAVVAGVSCGDSSGPQPGNLIVRLVSPNSGADSAMIVTITGPAPLTAATPGPGLRLFQQPLGNTTTRFALVGQLNANATVLTIGVANTGDFSAYSGTINAVALPNLQLRTSLSGYGLAVIR